MDSLPQPVLEALEFERSNYAAFSVKEDNFYKVLEDTANAAPGTPLKVDKDVCPTLGNGALSDPLPIGRSYWQKASRFSIRSLALRPTFASRRALNRCLGPWNKLSHCRGCPVQPQEFMAAFSWAISTCTSSIRRCSAGLVGIRRPRRCKWKFYHPPVPYLPQPRERHHLRCESSTGNLPGTFAQLCGHRTLSRRRCSLGYSPTASR